MPTPLGNFSYTWPFLAAALAGYLLGSIPFGLVLTRLAGLGDIRRIGSGNIGATNVLRTGRKALAALTLLLDGGKGAAAVLLAGRMGPDMAVLAGAGAVIGHLFPIWLRFRGGKGVATGLGVLLAAAWPAGLAACATWLVAALLFRYSSLAGRMGPDMAVLAGAGAVLGHLFPIWLRFRGGKGVATGLGVMLAAAWPAGLAACATWLLAALLFRYSSLAALLAFLLAPLYAWQLADPQQAQLAGFVALLVWLRHIANIRRLLRGEEPKIGAKD